ncbi:hypothetical protein ACIRL2_47355 [Embleya sp. NPDC127516]|uniref:hypothetical protein n=1 Tax=Embleya sp. NPDC127516 TaxID=3363990 RepID=UPI0038229CC4
MDFVSGSSGHLAVDGVRSLDEEIGRSVHDLSPEGHWLHRFWDRGLEPGMWPACELAYAAFMGGVTIYEAAQVTGPPNRWVEIPLESPLLE